MTQAKYDLTALTPATKTNADEGTTETRDDVPLGYNKIAAGVTLTIDGGGIGISAGTDDAFVTVGDELTFDADETRYRLVVGWSGVPAGDWSGVGIIATADGADRSRAQAIRKDSSSVTCQVDNVDGHVGTVLGTLAYQSAEVNADRQILGRLALTTDGVVDADIDGGLVELPRSGGGGGDAGKSTWATAWPFLVFYRWSTGRAETLWIQRFEPS